MALEVVRSLIRRGYHFRRAHRTKWECVNRLFSSTTFWRAVACGGMPQPAKSARLDFKFCGPSNDDIGRPRAAGRSCPLFTRFTP